MDTDSLENADQQQGEEQDKKQDKKQDGSSARPAQLTLRLESPLEESYKPSRGRRRKQGATTIAKVVNVVLNAATDEELIQRLRQCALSCRPV